MRWWAWAYPWCVIGELEAAGVYDPTAPDADFRRSIAEHLCAVGVSVDDVIAILGSDDPEAEMNLRVLFPGPRIRVDEFADRVGLSIEQLERIRIAAGLPRLPGGPEVQVFSARDEQAFISFGVGTALFGEEATLQFIRVMGSALSRVAEAAVALFGSHIGRSLDEQHAPPDVQFNASVDATQALSALGPALDTMSRFHAETAIRRLTRAREGATSFESGRLAVGFVDLVGFTPLAETMTIRRLGELFDEFEGLAGDLIAEHDGRLVKLIGDAVMFVALDPDAACEIALRLVEHFRGEANPVTPRGALALGEMLVRGGDYFGHVVNLAARAAELAVPYEILVSQEVVAAAGPRFNFEPAGRRMLKGFAEPAPLATLRRAQPSS
jgi:adenylate cyclase